MNKKLSKIGIAILSIGLILIFFGFLFSKRFFLFDYYFLYENSKSVMILGLLLFILGVVFTIIGTFLREKLQQPVIQKEEKEIFSGICPVCHQQFRTNVEIVSGYYVFNCNKCNSRLKVKKSYFFPVG